MASYKVVLAILFFLKIAALVHITELSPYFYLLGDGLEYVEYATGFSDHGVYAKATASGELVYSTRRLPGYPIFLALLNLGEDAVTVFYWSLAQVIICFFIIFFISSRIFKQHGAVPALFFAIFMSINLPWLHYVYVVHSDCLFAIMLLLGVFLISPPEMRYKFCPLSAAVGSLSLFIAALIRPDLAPLPICMGLLLLAAVISNRYKNNRRPKLPVAPFLLICMPPFIAFLVWSTRNYLKTGDFHFTSFVGQIMFKNEHSDTASGGISDLLLYVIVNLPDLADKMVLAVVNLFLNPSRWYLHKYLKEINFPLPSIDKSLSEVALTKLPIMELTYISFNVIVSVIILFFFCRFAFFWALGKGAISASSAIIIIGVTLFLILEKAVWGALDPTGSGQRFAMSIYPFLILFGSISFSKKRPVEEHNKVL